MFMLIAVLVPTFIGIKVIESLMKEEMDKRRYFYFFITLLLLSSVINNIISYVVFGVDMYVLDSLNTLPIFFVKYTLVSTLINVIMAFVIVVALKNVSIEVEVIKNEKRNSKREKQNK